jgi:bacteriocin biosynthesis cyclodehydratase domain-containing protein
MNVETFDSGDALQIFPKLLPLLDGSRTAPDVASEMGAILPRGKLLQLIELLKQKGLVREIEAVPAGLESGDLLLHESMARYLGRRGSRYAALAALKRAHIGVVNGGPVLPALVPLLAKLGVRRMTLIGSDKAGSVPGLQINQIEASSGEIEDWDETIRGMSMVVVLKEGPILFYPWLEKLNAAALSAGIPWTSIALLDGDTVHLGPTIRPNVTACYKCFELRLKSNLAFLNVNESFESYVRDSREIVDFGFLPPVAGIMAGFAALEVIRTLNPEDVAQTSGKLMVFNTADFSTSYHPVLKMPRCTACGPTRNQARQRIWS